MPFCPPSAFLPILGLALLAACGGGGSGAVVPPPPPGDECIEGTGPEVLVAGRVTYQRLVLTALGLGPALEVQPARFVDVEVRLEDGGTCYGTASADAAGDFSLLVRPDAGARLEVWAYARTDNDPLRRLTVHQALPPSSNNHATDDVFAWPSASFVAGSVAPVDFTVPYNPGTSDRPSMGFGALDVLLTCSEAIRTGTGVIPPLCHAYTELGNNGATGTSFYSQASRALTLLGGAAGNLDGSDTDYFDDAVIAHEYGHFVEHNLAHTLTRGGPHGGQALEPGFSWSEGHCTGFGCLCRKTPAYIDTYGTSGGLLISASAENWSQSVRGIGGEETVAEIVWDLGDGTGGITDQDGDVTATSLGSLYSALFTFDPATDAPYVGLFLERLVGASAVSSADVGTLMLAPENQQITWPPSGADVWPVPLDTPGSSSGVCDSTVANPCRALDASVWYVFTLATSATLTFDLEIAPIAGSGDDLDLYLMRASGLVIGTSASSGASDERIGPTTLSAGTYLVRVQADCAGAGNVAGYTLTAGSS